MFGSSFILDHVVTRANACQEILGHRGASTATTRGASAGRAVPASDARRVKRTYFFRHVLSRSAR